MTHETTLDAVRELSERAMLRPAPMHLPLAKADDLRPGPRRAVIPYEELYPLRIGGTAGRASTHKSHKRKDPDHENTPTTEKDFLTLAAEKAAAATERQPVVIPAGEGDRF